MVAGPRVLHPLPKSVRFHAVEKDWTQSSTGVTFMERLFACDGMCLGDVHVPPFEVFKGDHVGIANPADYGVQWHDLMQVLGGVRKLPEVHIAAQSTLISAGFQPLEQLTGSPAIMDVAQGERSSQTSAERVITSLGFDPARHLHLPLTPRLLLDLRLAWYRGARLVVPTAGLDPAGMLAVGSEVAKMLGPIGCSHVFSASLIQDYESSGSLDKVIHCNLLHGDPD